MEEIWRIIEEEVRSDSAGTEDRFQRAGDFLRLTGACARTQPYSNQLEIFSAFKCPRNLITTGEVGKLHQNV